MESYYKPKDSLDEWLYNEFGIIAGSCSAQKQAEYLTARMIAEKMQAGIQKRAREEAYDWLEDNSIKYIDSGGITNWRDLYKDFRKAMNI